MNYAVSVLCCFLIFNKPLTCTCQHIADQNIAQAVKPANLDGTDHSDGRTIKRTAKNTLTPVLLNRGDVLEFTLRNGQTRTLKLLETDASIMRTNVKDFAVEQKDGGTIVEFTAKVLIDGHEMTLQRYLPTQESFYEPYVINGMRIWFDAVQDYFSFFTLKHGWCKPRAHARLAVSDMADPVAPGLVPWYPIDDHFIDVRDSYMGDDVWMGPYRGAAPHAGLDINMPKGTPLFSPFDITGNDDQWLLVGFEPKPYYWAATWTGIKNWPNGSEWTLTVLHLDKYLLKDHTAIKKGTQFGEAAGTGVGAKEHSHFELRVRDEPVNTVDDKVMLLGQIISEEESTYKINVDGIEGDVPRSSALYIRRDDRPKDYSVFMVSKEVASRNGFKYEVPQIPLDPWYLIWQTFENDKSEKHLINAHIAPLSPAKTGEEVYFSSLGSRSGSKSGRLSYYWTFGDGGSSNEENPTYVFAAPGIYPVSLIVDDGENKDIFTQHITVTGERIGSPALSLSAAHQPMFDNRKPYVMDVYGSKLPGIPHTLEFVARPTHRQPAPATIDLVNNGSGDLRAASTKVFYENDKGWLKITAKGRGNAQRLTVSADSKGLSPGLYKADIEVYSPGAVNAKQRFRAFLSVLSTNPESAVVIDDRDSGFYATPWFWVGSRFGRSVAGYKGFFLTNGGRANEGEYVRFTPDVTEGNYEVSFVEETPFVNSKIKVMVRHAGGDSLVWVEPLRSRTIGSFRFSEGMDGFVQIFASGSEGEVIADAVRFVRVDNSVRKN